MRVWPVTEEVGLELSPQGEGIPLSVAITVGGGGGYEGTSGRGGGGYEGVSWYH